MGEVFIPLGGAGGKNRGTAAVLGDSTPFSNAGAVMSLPLPAGNYKKSVSNPRTSYGDGKNSEVTISKELLKKMAIEAFGIASITNFSATMYAHKQVRLTWAKPTRGLWSGVHFVFKYDSMPTSTGDGFTAYDSADVYYTTPILQERQLYVRAYNYVTTNEGRWYDDGAVSATIRVSGISGSVTFGAGAGTWTVPEGVRRIRYILVGHGGAGIKWYEGGAGGGGGYFTTGYMDVSPGQALPWVVPTAQGQATVLSGASAGSGNSPEKILSPARYGKPYQYEDFENHRNYTRGGSGGSGGGGGWRKLNVNGKYPPMLPGGGGSNGSMGYGTAYEGPEPFKDLQLSRGGDGQGSSTQGFNGVLYCGGGGGSGFSQETTGFSVKTYCQPKEQDTVVENGYHYYRYAGLGGAGGGGHGNRARIGGEYLKSATNGTDGLGGGGGGSEDDKDYRGRPIHGYTPSTAGLGGTGCIYIAWGSSMNDGS